MCERNKGVRFGKRVEGVGQVSVKGGGGKRVADRRGRRTGSEEARVVWSGSVFIEPKAGEDLLINLKKFGKTQKSI
jgi:hypothetical protein